MLIAKVKKELGPFKLNVSLRVAKEFALITGINGSGKSTLLRLIAGIDSPSEGLIISRGETFFNSGAVKTNLPPEKRGVGYIAQHNTLFPWLKVRENIDFAAVDAIDTEEITNKLGLQDFMDLYPRDLSGGQAQLVVLARTLAAKPSLLLLDEPLSKVDEDSRTKVLGYIKYIQREWDITVIMTSHHKDDKYICDSIIDLKDGSIKLRRINKETNAA